MHVEEHQHDEDGLHEPSDCEVCIEKNQSFDSSCRCGLCCEKLIIEVSLRDSEREPKINEKGSPIFCDISGTRELIGWLLNSKDGPCVFLDRESKLCTIYATRPLACRVFNCDESEFQQPAR